MHLLKCFVSSPMQGTSSAKCKIALGGKARHLEEGAGRELPGKDLRS